MRESTTQMTNDQMNPTMKRLLPFALSLVAACNLTEPAETRTSGEQFPVTANWSASAAPVGTGTASATLAMKQRLGLRIDAALQFTGAPNTTYQWRVYRGDCATTTVAANGTAPTGLLLFATTLSYPDFTTDASGKATVSRVIAGQLDSLKAYSLRARVFNAAAWNGTNPASCGNLSRSAGS